MIPGAYVAIRAEDFLILISCVILLFHWLSHRFNPLRYLFSRQFITYWIVGGLSVLSAIILTQSISPQLGLLHYFRRIEYMVCFFLAYQSVKDNINNKRFFLEVTLLTALGVFLYGIAQIYFGAPVISTMNTEFSKGIAIPLGPGVPISSTFAGHYDLAIYLVMVLCLFAALYQQINKWWQVLPISAIATALLWLLLQSGHRASAAAALFCITLIFILIKKYKLVPIYWAIFFILAVNSPNLMGRFGMFFNIFSLQRLIGSASIVKIASAADAPAISITSAPTITLTPTPEALRPLQQDRSTSIRLDVEWPRALRSFYKNPFLGTGYSSLTLATDNDYLRSLGETGMLGLLSFIAILIAFTRKAISLLRSSKVKLWWQSLPFGYIGVLATFIGIAVFIDVFEASKIAIIFWMLSGINFASPKS